MIPFPAQDGSDEDPRECGDVAGEDGRGKHRWILLVRASGSSKLHPSEEQRARSDGVEEFGDLGFVGIADNIGDPGEGSEFFGGTLGVATGYDDASGGIGGVELADGVAGLRVGGRGYGAGVEDDDVGDGRVRGKGIALLAELALDGGTIGLRGPAAELLDKESAHRRISRHPY